jgi:hypothetical protein
MQELGCSSTIIPSCVACAVALMRVLGKPLGLPTAFSIGVGALASRVIGSPPWADTSA